MLAWQRNRGSNDEEVVEFGLNKEEVENEEEEEKTSEVVDEFDEDAASWLERVKGQCDMEAG